MTTTNELQAQHDPFQLQRFVEAQGGVYAGVLQELRQGKKRSHWMWFIFPQIDGLGYSSMSKRYAIRSREEALAYFRHPLLGKRLVECTEAIVAIQDRSARDIFGSPDDMKLRSCLTLFASVAQAGSVFERALDMYFQGNRDGKTLELLDGRNE